MGEIGKMKEFNNYTGEWTDHECTVPIDGICEWIHSRRKAKGISIETLANEVGVTYAAAWKWDTGLQEPSARHVEKLAAVFGYKTEYIFRP